MGGVLLQDGSHVRVPLSAAKALDMFEYQSTIVMAPWNFETSAWVAYNRQYRCEALVNRKVNWCQTNARLYNGTFTGSAKSIPRCKHCLSDTHATANCPLEPNLGAVVATTQPSFSLTAPSSSEVCRKYNTGRCMFLQCQYRHVCQGCRYPHPLTQCPKRGTSPRGNQPHKRSPRSR